MINKVNPWPPVAINHGWFIRNDGFLCVVFIYISYVCVLLLFAFVLFLLLFSCCLLHMDIVVLCVCVLLLFVVVLLLLFRTRGTGQVQSMEKHGLRSAPPNFQVLDDARAGV